MAHTSTSFQTHDEKSGPRHAGMTLIETLLAVTITTLVLGLIYSIYFTTVTVVTDQQARIKGPVATMQVLEHLSQSLACSLQRSDLDTPAFELQPAEATRNKSSTLSFWTAEAPPHDNLQWYRMLSVVVRVGTEAEEQGLLFCETQEISGPEFELPPVTNILLQDVKSFRAELFDGNEWLEEWPSAGTPDMPQGARLTIALQGSGEHLYEAEVFIAAGHVVTSRLEIVTSESPNTAQ